jgi:hypothetical protein
MKKTKLLANFSLIVILLTNFGIIINVHAPNQEFTLIEIGHIPVEGYANDVQAVGDKIYLSDWLEGFLVYDMSNLGNISILGSYECPNNINPAVKGAKTFLVRDDYAIVGFQHAGLKILDISDPTNIVLVGEYFGGTDTYHIEVVDDLVYMAMEYDGLQILNISDVTQPTKVGEFVNGNPLYHINVVGNIAFIADYQLEKTLGLDISDPSNITEVGQFDWIPCTLEMVANIGYIGTIGEGVLVYDFSVPSEPIFLDELYNGGDAGDIVISGNYAFVAAVEEGLEILDITDPENLVEVAQFNDGGIARNVFVQENIAYVSEIEDGLEIIQLWGEDENNHTSSFSYVFMLPGLIIMFLLGKRKKRIEV